MVTSVTNLGRTGAFDWLMQRVSAVVLGVYTLFLAGYLLASPDLDYAQWAGLFDQMWMRIFSLLALISLGLHAWVGLWTITTDYIKPTALRFLIQAVCGLIMFVYLVWGVEILWGL
ncbi:succinate dehydrogenase subunit D [Halospina denitrificans]|uniref:Succinate dehydrogenase hydrophobic membrane anchor subunit n=1 Tax=Halospina denitrificans TaxID=332522 RepID=A0A4R7JTJ2_9GAMM|nr:succinate dehydrogenase, hydrophobic membrane anchor protein [Halospina denitrificans]TDT41610.1 succinate dehydrogenase subunit D [Halospina denitrificans]